MRSKIPSGTFQTRMPSASPSSTTEYITEVVQHALSAQQHSLPVVLETPSNEHSILYRAKGMSLLKTWAGATPALQLPQHGQASPSPIPPLLDG